MAAVSNSAANWIEGSASSQRSRATIDVGLLLDFRNELVGSTLDRKLVRHGGAFKPIRINLIIAKGLGIPTFLIFDADADDTKHQAEHQCDNTALLRAVGGDDTTSFSAATVLTNTHIVWPHDMGASVKAAVQEAAWTDSTNYASAQCGMAGDLAKNALHIGSRLTWLWEKGHRPDPLEQLCAKVVSFA